MINLPKKLEKIVYICGKTSTGKSTLSNLIAEKYSYEVIELDEVIYTLDARPGINPFIETYIERREMHLIHEFIDKVKKIIDEALKNNKGVVIEGAIANLTTFNELFSRFLNDLTFIYLHPVNLSEYTRRLKQRFDSSAPTNRNGLPGKFWAKFSDSDLSKYYKDGVATDAINQSINSYAIESMEESKRRLEMFQLQFPNVHVIEI